MPDNQMQQKSLLSEKKMMFPPGDRLLMLSSQQILLQPQWHPMFISTLLLKLQKVTLHHKDWVFKQTQQQFTDPETTNSDG